MKEIVMKSFDVRQDKKTGLYYVAGGILPPSLIEVGQSWISSSGSIVTVKSIDYSDPTDPLIGYEWNSNQGIASHKKFAFAFQCRYCLVVDKDNLPENLKDIVDIHSD